MKLMLPICCFLATILLHGKAAAQTDTTLKPTTRAIMKDTLDGKLDFSRFLIDAKGFIPVPFIITEPALGSFGLAIAPIFLTPKRKPPGYHGYIPPDITAGFAMYTANKSWMVGGMRIGNIPSKGIKYRIGGGMADINLSFFRELSNVGEKKNLSSVLKQCHSFFHYLKEC